MNTNLVNQYRHVSNTPSTVPSSVEEKIIDAEEVEFYDSINDFPEEGSVDIIYVDNTSGKSYTWNPDTSEYDVMNTNNIITGSIIQSTL